MRHTEPRPNEFEQLTSSFPDRFAAIDGAERSPDADIDALLDEADAAIAHGGLNAAGVPTAGRQDVPGPAIVHTGKVFVREIGAVLSDNVRRRGVGSVEGCELSARRPPGKAAQIAVPALYRFRGHQRIARAVGNTREPFLVWRPTKRRAQVFHRGRRRDVYLIIIGVAVIDDIIVRGDRWDRAGINYVGRTGKDSEPFARNVGGIGWVAVA